jgi:hypothetical protein
MRFERVPSIVANIEETTPEPHRIYFIATSTPSADWSAPVTSIVDKGDTWAKRINRGLRSTLEPTLFLGADDVLFHPGWLTSALGMLDGVVAVNDLHNPKGTLALVSREYANLGTIDGQRGIAHEGYRHNFVDDELFGTAQFRGRFTYCREAVVEHLHPCAGKAEDDETYRLGRESWEADEALHKARCALWTR